MDLKKHNLLKQKLKEYFKEKSLAVKQNYSGLE
jgi:hypothetical protein